MSQENDDRDYDALAMGVDKEGYLRVRPQSGDAAKLGEVTLSAEEVSISPLLT